MNAIWQVGDLSSVLRPGSFAPSFTPVTKSLALAGSSRWLIGFVVSANGLFWDFLAIPGGVAERRLLPAADIRVCSKATNSNGVD